MTSKKSDSVSQKIVILGTGGTIAGLSLIPGAGGAYRAAQVKVEDLVAQASNDAQSDAQSDTIEPTSGRPASRIDSGLTSRHLLVTEQLAQVDSKDMDESIWTRLLVRLDELQRDPEVKAVVITHGTDTLEETGFLLQACWPHGKPMVMTCAMRASDAPNADGPANLRDAIRLAATPGLRGVLMTCDGQVFEGHVFQKVTTAGVQPFDAQPLGALGHCRPGPFQTCREVDAQLAYAPLTEAERSVVLTCRAWPRVEILLNHAGADGSLVQALLASPPTQARRLQGMVVAGTGQGTYSERLGQALKQAREQGVRVWRSSRAVWSVVRSSDTDEFRGVPWSPVKARVAMMLDLMVGRV
jgi:L-asparaginase